MTSSDCYISNLDRSPWKPRRPTTQPPPPPVNVTKTVAKKLDFDQKPELLQNDASDLISDDKPKKPNLSQKVEQNGGKLTSANDKKKNQNFDKKVEPDTCTASSADRKARPVNIGLKTEHNGTTFVSTGHKKKSPKKISFSNVLTEKCISPDDPTPKPISSFESSSKLKSDVDTIENLLDSLASVVNIAPLKTPSGLPTVTEECDSCEKKRLPMEVKMPEVPSSFGKRNTRMGHLASMGLDSSLDDSCQFDQDIAEMSWDFGGELGSFVEEGDELIGACGETIPDPVLPHEVSFSELGNDLIGACAPELLNGGESKSVSVPPKQKKKKVKICEKEMKEGVISYRLRPDSICKVAFPAKTWDIMMQSFRIALELDNVFICDHFLGRDSAVAVFAELICMRNDGHFDRNMRTESVNDYSCLSLSKEDISHKHIDALALMVYKLANYHTNEWMGMSVDLSFFPNGHSKQHHPINKASNRKVLKCMYFFDPDWDWKDELEEEDDDQPGRSDAKPKAKSEYYGGLNIDAPSNRTKVDPVFDRLVVFWGDSLPHTVNACPKERFLILLSLYR